MNDPPPHATATTPPGDTALRPSGYIICHICQKMIECSPTSMLGFTREGWPKCCGEVMTLYTRRSCDDTKFI